MKKDLINKKKWTFRYRGKEWICGVAIDFEGVPALIIPDSLDKLLDDNGDSEDFYGIQNYDNSVWALPDKELYDNIDNIQEYMESYSPYWFADEWDGNYEVYTMSDLMK